MASEGAGASARDDGSVGARRRLPAELAAALALLAVPLVLAHTARGPAGTAAVGAAGVLAWVALLRAPRGQWMWSPLAAAAAGGAALPVCGTTAAGCLAIGVVIAQWVVRNRPPLPGLPPTDDGVRIGLIALAGVATWQAARGTSNLVIAALAAGAVVLTFTASVGARPFRRARAWVEALVGSLAAAVVFGVLGLVVVIVPWAAQRAVLLDPLATDAPRGTRWSERTGGPGRASQPWRRLPSPGSRGRRARQALATALVVGVLATLVVVIVRSEPPAAPAAHQNTDPNSIPAAYAGAAWYPDYRADISWLWQTSIAWDPLAPVRLRDVHTRTVNIDDGARRTWRAPACSCRRWKVWMYGGSTAFGLGQRDEYTTASFVARRAAADGIVLDVDNRGVVGDTHWEEAQRFAWDLATLPKPDLVVFLDGINEVQAVDRMTSRQRQPMNFVKDDFWKNYLERAGGIGIDPRWAPSDAPGGAPPGAEVVAAPPLGATSSSELGAVIAERYEWGRRISRGTAEANEVPIEWFWQPSIEFRPDVAGEPPAAGRDFARDRILSALRAVGPEVHDLTRAYDGHDEALFWDSYHTNETGADLVAAALYRQLRPTLARLGADG